MLMLGVTFGTCEIHSVGGKGVVESGSG